ncbi:MAG TPA: hypothetical protein VGT02_13165, partial [Methylomirabilota bacterium]|nr:hypothetical protein [Methylomirabilota bacterium]
MASDTANLAWRLAHPEAAATFSWAGFKARAELAAFYESPGGGQVREVPLGQAPPAGWVKISLQRARAIELGRPLRGGAEGLAVAAAGAAARRPLLSPAFGLAQQVARAQRHPRKPKPPRERRP